MSQADLDPIAILAALGVADATGATPVTGGQDTAIWRVEHSGMVSALRVFRPEQARVARREVAAMRVAAAGGIAAPTVRAEGMWWGRPALLLAWCPGETMLGALRARPWRIGALGVLFGRTQARIHRVPAADLPQEPEAWIDWAGRVDKPLRERLRAAAHRPPVLLHLDYHPLNVMTDDRRVTGVLDWANALPGDPRADLARTLVLHRFTPGNILSRRERLAVRLHERAWWRGYRQVAGAVGEMALFYAWAGLATVRDQEQKIGRPGITLQSSDLDPLRRWTALWRRRAGVHQ